MEIETKLVLHEGGDDYTWLNTVAPGYPGAPALWHVVATAPNIHLHREYRGEWVDVTRLPTIQAVYNSDASRRGVILWGSGYSLIITQAEWDAILREYAAATAEVDARIADRTQQETAIATVVAGLSPAHQAAYHRYGLNPASASMAEDYGAAARLVEIQRVCRAAAEGRPRL